MPTLLGRYRFGEKAAASRQSSREIDERTKRDVRPYRLSVEQGNWTAALLQCLLLRMFQRRKVLVVSICARILGF
jgi:hypothetical protein